MSLTTEPDLTYRISMSQITFHGAAGTVTGSRFLLEADGTRVLIDWGMFQGVRNLRWRHWDATPLDVKSLNGVVLSHPHLDYSGYLPGIVKEGQLHRFGIIFTTWDIRSVQTRSTLKFATKSPFCVCSSRAMLAASTAYARRIPSFKLNDCEGRHS